FHRSAHRPSRRGAHCRRRRSQLAIGLPDEECGLSSRIDVPQSLPYGRLVMIANVAWRRCALNGIGLLVAALIATAAQNVTAQPGYYAGKTVRIVVGSSAGGGYDTYARAMAPFLAEHLPGKPTVVVQNMPGGGGLTSVMFLDANAPKDGTVITLFNAGVT